MLIKEQNNSSKLTVVRSNWLPKQFQITVSSFFSQKVMVILISENVWFLNKNVLLNLATIFLLIWSTFKLVSAKKERFFLFSLLN